MTLVQLRRHVGPWPQSGCRSLAKFDQLGPTRAQRWGACLLQSRRWCRGHCRPRWLEDQSLVLEALHPLPLSRQAGSQRSRRPPGCAITLILFVSHHFVSHRYANTILQVLPIQQFFIKQAPQWRRCICSRPGLQWQEASKGVNS